MIAEKSFISRSQSFVGSIASESYAGSSRKSLSTAGTSTSSSEDDDESTASSIKDIQANDYKLAQMRRSIKRRGGGRSRVAKNLEHLQSYDEMVRNHALTRMQEGIKTLLKLHNPVELSSLCGCLRLKVQEKGSTSIQQIMKYMMKDKKEFELQVGTVSTSNQISAGTKFETDESEKTQEDRIKRVLNFMWEGALWEYLHSIGHPIHTMRPDPRTTILHIWETGGILSKNFGFVPHFISREIKKRYQWVQSEDIQKRLVKLREVQEAAKLAEKQIIVDHDYTNILTYFNKMSHLRSLENSVREYLISEVEISRSRLDSNAEAAKMSRKQLAENEQYYETIVNQLNDELAHYEYVSEDNMDKRIEVEQDIIRLSNILDSYAFAQEDRDRHHESDDDDEYSGNDRFHSNSNDNGLYESQEGTNIGESQEIQPERKGGFEKSVTFEDDHDNNSEVSKKSKGSRASKSENFGNINSIDDKSLNSQSRQESFDGPIIPLRLKNFHECHPSIRELHQKLQDYKIQRDHSDKNLRTFARAQRKEIKDLKKKIEELETQLSDTTDQLQDQTKKRQFLERELFLSQRETLRLKSSSAIRIEKGWESSIQFASKKNTLERQINTIKPLIKTGLQYSSNLEVKRICNILNSVFRLIPQSEVSRFEENSNMRNEELLSFNVREEERKKAETEALKGKKVIKMSSLMGGKKGKDKGKGKSPVKRRKGGKDDATVKSQKSTSTTGSGKTKSRSKK